LSEVTQQYVWEATRQVVEDLVPENSVFVASTINATPAERPYIVGVPAQDTSDELALLMLSRLMPANVDFETVPLKSSSLELIGQLSERPPAMVCISSLGPIGGAQTRYICKRIRQSFETLPILVTRWAYQGDREKWTKSSRARGASFVASSLKEALDVVARAQPLVKINGTVNAAIGA
jgi:hypothetical protein